MIDLTQGELGTRGTPEIRAQEAAASSELLKLDVRENMGFRDGFFKIDDTHQLELIKVIRRYQPDIILINAPHDRHPDHGRGSKLVRDSAFLAGLRRVPTSWQGAPQEAWRPAKVYKYIQDQWIVPNFVVDISAHFAAKMEAIRAFKSQFYNPEGKDGEPETYISITQAQEHAAEGPCKCHGRDFLIERVTEQISGKDLVCFILNVVEVVDDIFDLLHFAVDSVVF